MNESERKVLRKCHRELVENIDPYELRAFLYSKGVLPNPTFLDNVQVRTKRAEQFLEYIVERCPFSLFLESLSDDNAFDFLAVTLQEELENTEEDDVTSQHIHHELKESLFSPERAKVVSLRHKLKRYSLTGDTNAFFKECKTVTDKWNAIPKETRFLCNNKELADMYCMVLDAKMDRRRILYDKTLYKDDELFDTMQKMSLYTSSATLPVVMYLVRYGSALLMAGKSVDVALSHVERAKQCLQTLPACLESGVVLYIEYNMLISEKYEKMPTLKMKSRLLEIGRKSIDHFCREQETVGKDFRRMVLIKQSLLLLGVGLFLNNLDNVIITTEDMKQAETLLQEIQKEENWERMEARWKVRYHAAKSKLFFLKGSKSEALIEMQKASEYAIVGNSKKEIDNITDSVALMSGRRTFNLKYLFLVLALVSLVAALLLRYWLRATYQ